MSKLTGTIKSSKPTLIGISSTSPSKNVLHVNRDGVLTERAGPIYMTQIVEPISKEDVFLPVVYVDSYGNLMPIVRSSAAEDVYGGQPLKRIRE